MVDRRIIAAITAIVAVAALLIGRGTGGDSSAPTAPPATLAAKTPRPGAFVPTTPDEPGGTSTMPASTAPPDARTPEETSAAVATASDPTSQPTGAAAPDDTSVPTVSLPVDGHAHDGDLTAAPAGDLASAAAVSWLSWRYDDPADRVVDDLLMVATSELLDRLAVDPAEVARRQAAGEVSWAIVTRPPTVPATTGDVTVTVGVEQHLVSDTSPETVVPRDVTVTLTPTATGWLIADLA